MPWTTPETFTAGQTLTAASMNAITGNLSSVSPLVVTTLPASPAVGDVVVYQADGTNGVLWQLVYDGVGTYPWKFIGGPPMYNYGGGDNTSSTSYVDCGGASLTLPLAGDFVIDFRCHYALASGETGYLSIYLGTTAADGDAAYAYGSSSNNDGELAKVMRKTLTSAGTVVKTQARMGSGGPRGFTRVQLAITPIRVKA